MTFVTNTPNDPVADLTPTAAVSAMSTALPSTSPHTMPARSGGSRRRVRRCLAARAIAR